MHEKLTQNPQNTQNTKQVCMPFASLGRMLEKDRLNDLTQKIINAAITVHHELGPGLLESAYEACLSYELLQRGLSFERQKPLPLVYKDVRLDCGYRLDLLVENAVVIDVKCVERFTPLHMAQLRSYLRLSGCRVGLIINFNVKWLTADGLKRVVNDFPE